MKKGKKKELFEVLYNLVLVVLAVFSAFGSVAYADLEKLPAYNKIDFAIFLLFSFDVSVKVLYYLYKKNRDRGTRFQSVTNPILFVFDVAALAPDIVELLLSQSTINFKILRAVRAMKLLRVLRVYTKNRRLHRKILNFVRYRLHGAWLVFFVNCLAMTVFVLFFAYVNFEYINGTGVQSSFVNNLKWALFSLIDPFGMGLDLSRGLLSQQLSIVLSVLGLFVFATIIAVASDSYGALFDYIKKGVSMDSVKNQYVLLGWNHFVPGILSNLILEHGKDVFVAANLDKEDVVRSRMFAMGLEHVYKHPNFSYTKIDYTNKEKLKQINITGASKIIIVYDEAVDLGAENTRDSRILFTLNIIDDIFAEAGIVDCPKIICEIFNKDNKRIFNRFRERFDLEVVNKEDLFSNLFSQIVSQENIVDIYTELLQSEDKEIYLLPFMAEVKGKAYRVLAKCLAQKLLSDCSHL